MPAHIGDLVLQLIFGGITSAITGRPKSFSTGSQGYFVWGRVVDVNGEQYQLTGNLVKIGSKSTGSKPKSKSALASVKV